MACRFSCSAVLFALLSLLAEPFANAQQVQAIPADLKKNALVVGIDHYADPGLPPLHYAVNDATQVASSLRNIGFSVNTLTGDAATRTAILQALRLLTERASPDGITVLYFSGHGFNVGAEGYLAGSDTESHVSGRSALSLREVQSLLRSAPGKNILILDACVSGPAVSESSGTAWNPALRDGGSASFAMYSTSSGGQSFESDILGHGVFTYYLLRGLDGEGATKTGTITWRGLAEYVTSAVARVSHLFSLPEITVSTFGSDFVLAATTGHHDTAVFWVAMPAFDPSVSPLPHAVNDAAQVVGSFSAVDGSIDDSPAAFSPVELSIHRASPSASDSSLVADPTTWAFVTSSAFVWSGSSVSVAPTGQFTQWVQGTTSANFGSGITVASLTVSSTSATAIDDQGQFISFNGQGADGNYFTQDGVSANFGVTGYGPLVQAAPVTAIVVDTSPLAQEAVSSRYGLEFCGELSRSPPGEALTRPLESFSEIERLEMIRVWDHAVRSGNEMAFRRVGSLYPGTVYYVMAQEEIARITYAGNRFWAKGPSMPDSARSGWDDKIAAFTFGVVFIAVMLVLVVWIREPTPTQWFVFRVVISLAAAGIGAVLPGLIRVDVSPYIRAGGAIALFVIVYWFNPPKLVVGGEPVAATRSPRKSGLGGQGGGV